MAQVSGGGDNHDQEAAGGLGPAQLTNKDDVVTNHPYTASATAEGVNTRISLRKRVQAAQDEIALLLPLCPVEKLRVRNVLSYLCQLISPLEVSRTLLYSCLFWRFFCLVHSPVMGLGTHVDVVNFDSPRTFCRTPTMGT